jgi:hypothetical protein
LQTVNQGFPNFGVRKPYVRFFKKILDNPDILTEYGPMNGGMKNQGETKRCPKCGEAKPLEAFTLDRSRPDGLRSGCQQCHQEYVDANREAINARHKAHYAANQEAILAKKKAYRAANPEVIAATQKKYYATNREVVLTRHKARREGNIAYLASLRPLKCEVCGYDKNFAALDFHHTNSSQKEHGRDTMWRWLQLSPIRFTATVDANSFMILCVNCHRSYHAKERNEQATVPTRQRVRLNALREANLSYLGSIRPLECGVCGHSQRFAEIEFHHTDPGQKEHKRDCMSNWLQFPLARFQAKVQPAFFIILCANCHRELHANETRSI